MKLEKYFRALYIETEIVLHDAWQFYVNFLK